MVRMVREGMALEELPQDAGRGPCRLLLRMASTRSRGNAPGLPHDSGRVPAAHELRIVNTCVKPDTGQATSKSWEVLCAESTT